MGRMKFFRQGALPRRLRHKYRKRTQSTYISYVNYILPIRLYFNLSSYFAQSLQIIHNTDKDYSFIIDFYLVSLHI